LTIGLNGLDARARTVLATAAAALCAVAFGAAAPTGTANAAQSARSQVAYVDVIVRERPGAGARPERLVTRAGGTVGRQIGIIRGFVARVPASALPALRASAFVHSVTRDRPVTLLKSEGVDGHDVKRDLGSMYYVAQEVTGAAELWNDGYTGRGVDVALIDSGVVPVEGLATSGKIVYGPDLSFESQSDDLRHLDTYGHGTHLAGIIAGRDSAISSRIQKGEERFAGMAPGARIVSVKVADAFGATDVSQVIAAIDWVVQNRNRNGLNIRVLNLSFGTDGEQDYMVDPLAYAAEVAWRKGIVVVVAAGNGGYGSDKMNNPAYDPYVIAVGGADGNGTYDEDDDTVPTWSSWGDGSRNPDLVAPGKSIVSLRAPGSLIDVENPGARVGDTPRFFRGSGTSQAAAVVSGAAALLIQQRPSITPDQLKALLMRTARELPEADARGQGAGMIDLKEAKGKRTPLAVQTWPLATGVGSLDLSRGSARLDDGTGVLAGEQDIFGTQWDGVRWSTTSLAEATWAGGEWNGVRWSGDSWDDGWLGVRWSGVRWSGVRWSGVRWSDATWSANTWTGVRWSGDTWTGVRWSGDTWSGVRWSGVRWSGAGWGD
jgi:subtilisin family serine protease